MFTDDDECATGKNLFLALTEEDLVVQEFIGGLDSRISHALIEPRNLDLFLVFTDLLQVIVQASEFFDFTIQFILDLGIDLVGAFCNNRDGFV